MIGKLKCKFVRQAVNEAGNVELTFEVAPEGRFVAYETVRKARELADKGKVYLSASLTEYREKRSLSANAYMWVLCERLAERLSDGKSNFTKEDVYRKAIGEMGVFKDFEGLSQTDAKTLRHAWELLGTGWITEQVGYMPDGENVTVRCYYGSSVYNKKQMSRLLDGIVQDCKVLGIETETPEELARMKAEWAA